MNADDEVTLNGKIIGVNKYTICVEMSNSHMRVLVKPKDINTIHPYKEPSKEDMRRGN